MADEKTELVAKPEPATTSLDGMPNFPKTFCEGSEGAIIDFILAFLIGKVMMTGLRTDGEYGPTSVAYMKYFQAQEGIPATGECDTRTREVLAGYGVHIEDVARRCGTLQHKFVQPNGDTIIWRARVR